MMNRSRKLFILCLIVLSLLAFYMGWLTKARGAPITNVVVNFADGTSQTIPATQPATTPPVTPSLPPLTAVPANAIHIDSDADWSKANAATTGACVAFKRGVTFHTTDGIWTVASGVRYTAYGEGALPIIKWANPGSPTWQSCFYIPSSAAGIQIDSLAFDVAPVRCIGLDGSATIRNLQIDSCEDVVICGASAHDVKIDSCVQRGRDMRGYFCFITQGGKNITITNCSTIFSVSQSPVRGVGENVEVAGCSFANGVPSPKFTGIKAQGGSWNIHDNTLTWADLYIGPDNNQPFTLTSYIATNNTLLNSRFIVFPGCGAVTIDGVKGNSASSIGIRIDVGRDVTHGPPDTTRTIETLTLKNLPVGAAVNVAPGIVKTQVGP